METGRAMTFMAANTYITLSALHPAYTYLCTVSAVTVADGPETSPTAVITLEEGVLCNCFLLASPIPALYCLIIYAVLDDVKLLRVLAKTAQLTSKME